MSRDHPLLVYPYRPIEAGIANGQGLSNSDLFSQLLFVQDSTVVVQAVFEFNVTNPHIPSFCKIRPGPHLPQHLRPDGTSCKFPKSAGLVQTKFYRRWTETDCFCGESAEYKLVRVARGIVVPALGTDEVAISP